MKLDPKKTAVLCMDLQGAIFEMFPIADSILPTASKAIELARAQNYQLIHVTVGFTPGYPEISPKHLRFSQLKQSGKFLQGTPSSAVVSPLFKEGDLLIHKHRVSAFHENSLDLILRSKGIENLVMFGISTSGVVLSTLRRAYDLDYQCTVLKDACLDRDAEVHHVLTEKVFADQATVQTVAEFIETQR